MTAPPAGAPAAPAAPATINYRLKGDANWDGFVNAADIKIVLAHMDRSPEDVPLGDFERLLDRGAYLSFDGWWGTNEPHPVRSFAATREQNIDRVEALLGEGYEKQLLLSNGSVAFTDCLPVTFTGEYAPYTQLQLDIIPALRGRGVTEEQIRRLTVDNARELFERCAQGPY